MRVELDAAKRLGPWPPRSRKALARVAKELSKLAAEVREG
jgi:hypothetical protein